MKKMLLLFAVALVCATAKAQKDFEGIVYYDMEATSSDIDPETASIIPKQMVVYIKKGLSRTDVETPSSKTTVIHDMSKNTAAVIVTDDKGQKTAMKFDSEFLTKINKGEAMFEVKYLGESKKIAGYTCQKMNLIYKDTGDTYDVWFTKELPPIANIMFQNMPEIDGFPLELNYKMENGVEFKAAVKDIKKEAVEDSLFNIPEDH